VSHRAALRRAPRLTLTAAVQVFAHAIKLASQTSEDGLKNALKYIKVASATQSQALPKVLAEVPATPHTGGRVCLTGDS
jgi:hypothetical protein